MQTHLPKHPFIPFLELAQTIANLHVPSSFKKKLFLFFSKLWFVLFGIARLETRIRDCFARGENGHEARYRRFPSIYCPEFSATLILNSDSDEDPVQKASRIIVGALRFRERVLGNQLEPDREGGRALDMERYRFFFSRLLVSSVNKGALVNETVDVPATDYIIVAVDGIYYKLQVLAAQKIIPVNEIHEQLGHIIADAKSQLSQPDEQRLPFGLFTVFHNKKSAVLLEKLLPKSQAELTVMDNSLFFIAIDINERPATLEKLSRTIHRQNFHSRDYRRSMQIVVTGNGQAGVIGDPSAGIGGGFVARFLDELKNECQGLAGEALDSPGRSGEPLYRRLALQSDQLPRYRAQLAALRRQVESQLYADDHDTVFRLEGVGKKDFARFAVSTDGVFHAGLHLAFKRCFGKTPNIGNFIGLRSIQHGEIYRYNSSTAEMTKFADSPNAETLSAALQAHKDLIKKTKQGTDAFYQMQMLLVTLYFRYEIGTFCFISLLVLLSLCIPNYTRRVMNQDMWVSHIPEYPGISLTGRPGVKLGFLKAPSLGGHYMIFDHHTMICFVSNPGHPSYYGQEPKFASALKDALTEILHILSRHSSHPASPAQARV